jgi:4-amino-4-deoxy-L-arabinose transferase-like glycosyltransferase
MALLAWVFLAINPFFLAQSRSVHTDALATLFMLLTILLFLLYCVSARQRCYLIFSGIAFGLAFLSKSYVIILLPWMPLCLFLFRQRGETWKFLLFDAFWSGLVFLNCCLLTFFILWPIFWTPLFGLRALCLFGGILFLLLGKRRDQAFVTGTAFAVLIAVGFFAVETFWEVFSGTVRWAVTAGTEAEHFFLGKVVSNPGWLFYPFVLSIESTPFTIPLAIGGMVWLWKQKKENTPIAQQLRIAISFLGCILLFTLCLSLTARKFNRYLLPVFLMLDVLAGIGLFYTVKWIGARMKKTYFRRVAHAACVALILLLTAVPVFALHPYYGTYYNLCWKGTNISEIITVSDTAGLDLAAKYINEKSNANPIAVQASDLGAEVLSHYLKGTVYSVDEKLMEGTSKLRRADYEVVYIRDTQIGRVPQTGTRNGQLEHTITLNGIDRVWIYKVSDPPETIDENGVLP